MTLSVPGATSSSASAAPIDTIQPFWCRAPRRPAKVDGVHAAVTCWSVAWALRTLVQCCAGNCQGMSGFSPVCAATRAVLHLQLEQFAEHLGSGSE